MGSVQFIRANGPKPFGVLARELLQLVIVARANAAEERDRHDEKACEKQPTAGKADESERGHAVRFSGREAGKSAVLSGFSSFSAKFISAVTRHAGTKLCLFQL